MTFANLRIASKFPLVVIAVAVLTGVATGLTAQLKYAADLEAFAKQALTALRESRQAALESYLDSIGQDLRLLASTEDVRAAVVAFSEAADELGDPPGEALRHLFVGNGPAAPNLRPESEAAHDNSRYIRLHARYHPWFRQIARERGYHDIFLFSPQGDLVYTVAKEPDFGTNFLHGAWVDSNLGKLVHALSANPRPGRELFADFAYYVPSQKPASFMATPVYNAASRYIGILAFQMPTDRINRVMRVSAGLGRTGQSFIVGPERLMRTDSPLSRRSTIFRTRVVTDASRRALAGESGVEIEAGYRGVRVVSAFAPLAFMGAQWAVLTEIERAELLRPVDEATNYMLVAGAIILLLATTAGLLFGRGLARPIVQMTENLRRLADGDLDVPVSHGNRSDEIGDMARAMTVFRENLRERRRAEQALAEKEAQLRLTMDNMPAGIALYDADFKVVMANDTAHELLDFPRELMTPGRPVADAYRYHAERGDYGPGDPEALVRERFEVFARRESAIREVHTATGRIVDIRSSPVADGGMIVVFNDVTARRTAEKELARKREQLELAMEHMPGAMFMVATNRSILLANKQCETLFELPKGSIVIGEPIDSVVRILAERGIYGPGSVDERVQETLSLIENPRQLIERRLPSGRILEVRQVLAPAGGLLAVAIDVTERRRAEESLRRSQEELAEKSNMLESILRSLNEGIVAFDRDLKLLAWNQPYLEIRDFPRDFLRLGRSFEDIVRYDVARYAPVESDAESIVQQVLAQARNSQPHAFERERPDGIWVEVRGGPIDGGGFVSTCADITARKAAEEETSRQRRLLNQVLATMAQAIAKYDKDRRLEIWNDNFRDYLELPDGLVTPGREAHEVTAFIARRGDYGDGDVARLVAARLDEVLTGKPGRSEITVGTDKFFDNSWRPTDDGGLVITYTDITERKRAEAEVARQKELLEATMENMDQAIGMWDADFNLVAFNEKLRDIMDLPPALMARGTPVEAWYRFAAERGDYVRSDIFNSVDAETAVEARMASVRRGETTRYERPLPDGRIVEIRRNVIGSGGFVSTYTDVTERKRAEERIRGAYQVIHESVQYASRIQRSLLPPAERLSQVFGEHFVVWEPRDLVGGDFYWLEPVRGGHLLIVCDCTGHGVPGAFMTILGTGALTRALYDHRDGDPAAVLAAMNRMVKRSLLQDTAEGQSDDGMELGVCRLGDDGRLVFAGARFALLVGKDGAIEQVKGDRTGIGDRRADPEFRFTNHAIETTPEMAFYLHSDGITDQIGGDKRQGFGRRRLTALLAELHEQPMPAQAEGLMHAFAAYQGGEARRDDVTVFGFRCRAG